MSDNQNFQLQKEIFVALLNLQLPIVAAAKYLGVHPTTAASYFINLKKEGRSEKTETATKSYSAMLSLCAKLSFSAIKIDKCLSVAKLLKVLNWFLEVDKIIETLNYCCKYLRQFQDVSFSENVPEAYQLFIVDIFSRPNNPNDKSSYYWFQYLRRINSSEINPAERMSEVIDQIMQDYAQTVRNNLAPVFTEEICRLVDERLLVLLDADLFKIVRLYYGFDGQPMSSKEISAALGVSRLRINQHKLYFRKFLLRHKSVIFCESMSWQYMVNQVDEAVKNETSKWQEDLNERHRFIERIEQLPSPNKKKHLVASYDISTRLKHLLDKMDIVYFEDVSLYSENDFLKRRDFGANTMKELKTIIENFGINFKKKLSPK